MLGDHPPNEMIRSNRMGWNNRNNRVYNCTYWTSFTFTLCRLIWFRFDSTNYSIILLIFIVKANARSRTHTHTYTRAGHRNQAQFKTSLSVCYFVSSPFYFYFSCSMPIHLTSAKINFKLQKRRRGEKGRKAEYEYIDSVRLFWSAYDNNSIEFV